MSVALDRSILVETLGVEKLVDDFNPSGDGLTANADLAVIGNAVGITKDLLGSFGVKGLFTGPIGIFAGLFAITGNTLPKPKDPTVDMKIMVQDRLIDILTGTQDAIAAFNAKLFGGTPKTAIDFETIVDESLKGITIPPIANTHHISRAFANGAFMGAPSTSDLQNSFKKGLDSTRKSLVTALLANQGYYVWVDLSITEASGCEETGSRWMQSVSVTRLPFKFALR